MLGPRPALLAAALLLSSASAAPGSSPNGPSGLKMPRSAILSRLDALPCFVVVDAYRVPPPPSEGDDSPLTPLYLCCEAAKTALKKARIRHPTLDLSIQPVGLGFAFGLCGGEKSGGTSDLSLSEGGTRLVASRREVSAARSLPGGERADWEASVPLFGCFSLRQVGREGSGREGSTVTPLYLSRDDAALAIAEAEAERRRAGGGGFEPLELRTIPLREMVSNMERGLLNADPHSFTFVPSRASVAFLSTLETPKGLADLVNAGEEVTRAGKQVIKQLTDEKRIASAARETNLFPD